MTTASGNAARGWLRHVVILALLAVLVVPMAGCGKKGPLDPPADSTEEHPYPRPYPTQ